MKPKSFRSLQKQLLNDTPPGVVVYDDDEVSVTALRNEGHVSHYVTYLSLSCC